MNIIIVGDGKVGYTLAQFLSKDGHDITIIDKNAEALSRASETLDVMCVRGNGANVRTLIEAGIESADIIISVTGNDELNMVCCLAAKQLGAKYSIARIRDPEYTESLTMLQKKLDIDQVINPERATAQEISRLLRFPFASNIESFAKGQVEMVEFRAQAQDVIVGWPLKNLSARQPMMPRVLYAAVERGGRVIIPNGDFIIEVGDRVHVVADMMTITDYFRFLGKNARRTRNVMLLGGGRISYYLAKMLVPMGIHVKMIEINQPKAARLSEMLPHVDVIHGDGTDHELLSEEGLDKTDALIALTGIDEENIILSMYANSLNVDKVVTKVNNTRLADMLAPMGIESIISPKEIAANRIISYVRAMTNATGSNVEMLYRLADNKVEALEFRVRESSRCIGVPLKDMPIKDDVLIGAIIRGGTCIIPGGDDVIKAHDSVIVVTTMNGLHELDKILKEKE